jgi:hypothetical protein
MSEIRGFKPSDIVWFWLVVIYVVTTGLWLSGR